MTRSEFCNEHKFVTESIDRLEDDFKDTHRDMVHMKLLLFALLCTGLISTGFIGEFMLLLGV